MIWKNSREARQSGTRAEPLPERGGPEDARFTPAPSRSHISGAAKCSARSSHSSPSPATALAISAAASPTAGVGLRRGTHVDDVRSNGPCTTTILERTSAARIMATALAATRPTAGATATTVTATAARRRAACATPTTGTARARDRAASARRRILLPRRRRRPAAMRLLLRVFLRLGLCARVRPQQWRLLYDELQRRKLPTAATAAVVVYLRSFPSIFFPIFFCIALFSCIAAATLPPPPRRGALREMEQQPGGQRPSSGPVAVARPISGAAAPVAMPTCSVPVAGRRRRGRAADRRARRRSLAVAGRRPRRHHARRRRVLRQQPGCRRVGPADGRRRRGVVVGPLRRQEDSTREWVEGCSGECVLYVK